MRLVRLVAKTNKGKSRLADLRWRGHASALWEVVESRETVLLSTKPGPWLYVCPLELAQTHSRWVHETEDEHFTVVPVDN